MSERAQTFRIFVSSTFSDLKAERNALQAFVFPSLRELCQQHNARFQPIDLRWGVSEEASLDQQAMNICLSEVQRCQDTSPRPNFIVLLGDRYGWMPPPAQIPQDEYEQILSVISADDKSLLAEWYTEDKNARIPMGDGQFQHEYRLNPREKGGSYEDYQDWQLVESRLHEILSRAVEKLDFPKGRKLAYQASATHQEIHAGALSRRGAAEHVFCFLRHISNLPQEFNLPAFQKMFSARLQLEYPQGLTGNSEALVDWVKNLPTGLGPTQLQDQIEAKVEEYPKGSLEKEVLKFMSQALADYLARDFINLREEDSSIDQAAYERLGALKETLRNRFSANLFTAEAVRWMGDQLPTEEQPYQPISTDHIGALPETLEACQPILETGYTPKNLCEAVFQSLGRVILAEIEAPHVVETAAEAFHIQPSETLDAEGRANHVFAEERLEYFVGREGILGEIANYLRSDDRKLFVIAGEGGSGKSALIAKAVEEAQAAHPDAALVYRFIGATPGSSDARSLLNSLCREISRVYGAPEDDVPIGFRDLVPEFNQRLGLAKADQPLLVFLDSLDQLSEAHGARGLSWLPSELPAGVSLVVSTRMDEDVYDQVSRKGVTEAHLGGLGVKEGELLLDQWLADNHRGLQDEQKREVLKKFTASGENPLYLKLAFEEARLWISYEDSQDELAKGVSGIIQDNMLDRLMDEGNHGRAMVSHALGYLAASRYGLTEDELVDLLSRDPEVYEWFFRQSYHLPSDLVKLAMSYLKAHPEALADFPADSYHDAERLARDWLAQDRTPPEPVNHFLQEVLGRLDGPRLPIVLWSRLSFDLAPYLSTRMVDGSSLRTFYHRELDDVSKATFLKDDQAKAFHQNLADYFESRADPEGAKSWTGSYLHGLSELPYHLTMAEERDRVFKLLTDFTFLEHKAEEVGITRRIGEFGLEEVTSEGVQDLQKDYDLALRKLYGSGGEEADRAPLIRTAEKSGGVLRVYCPVCNQKSKIGKEDLGQVITCPKEGCGTKLKLNPFTIQMN
jgi:hypothetical protein